MPIYELSCVKCGVSERYAVLPTDEDFPCPKCGGETKRLYSLTNVKVFEVFSTRNILPGGEPVTITSQSQLSHLCNEFHLNHLDDPKHESKHARPKTVGEILGEPNVMPDTREEASGPARAEDLL